MAQKYFRLGWGKVGETYHMFQSNMKSACAKHVRTWDIKLSKVEPPHNKICKTCAKREDIDLSDVEKTEKPKRRTRKTKGTSSKKKEA